VFRGKVVASLDKGVAFLWLRTATDSTATAAMRANLAQAAEEEQHEEKGAEAEHDVNAVTRVVCREDFLPAHGVSCAGEEGGHFVCGLSPGDGCLSKHVHARGLALRGLTQLAAREKKALAAGDTRRARHLGGAVHCVAAILQAETTIILNSTPLPVTRWLSTLTKGSLQTVYLRQ
jgi:hypothetical protein